MKKNIKVILVISMIVIPLIIVSGFTLLALSGEIKPYAQVIVLSGEINSAMPPQIIPQIEAASDDPSVKAIILEINSPGGTVVASKNIANAVAASEKPVVALINELGASGAYWIASSSDKIVADPASITGSIGVSGSYLQYQGLFEKYGIGYERLVTGLYKDTGTPYRSMTPGEEELMLGKLNKILDMFVSQVSTSRNIPESTVRKLATGEIFLGVEAYDNGLVDYLGGKEKALEVANTLTGESLSISEDYGASSNWLDLFTEKAAYWFGQGFAEALFKLTEQQKGFTA